MAQSSPAGPRGWADRLTTEVERAAVLVVPLGATEQHGPHLPLDTDTRIAVAWAEALAHRAPGIAVAPPLPYGSSGEHQAFPGTLSIGQPALQTLLVELARSVRGQVDRLMFLSGHAGNAEPLAAAVKQLRVEGHDVIGLLPRIEGADAHAGRTETSLMLAIDPSVVRLDRAEPGAPDELPAIIEMLRAGGVGAVSPNGVLGDPTGATADEGRAILEQLVVSALNALAEP